MPEYYADKMRELYEIIERMGVTRQMEGVESSKEDLLRKWSKMRFSQCKSMYIKL